MSTSPKIYYKAVRPNLKSACNAAHDAFSGFRKNVQYKVNEWVKAPDDTRLFVFDNLDKAKRFAYGEYDVWECHVKGARKGFPCNQITEITSFWKILNEKFFSKKKKINFKSEDLIWRIENSVPSILAKQVKLVRKIS